MVLDNLPHELMLNILKYFYTNNEYNHVSHAYALGVVRQVGRKYKNLVDVLFCESPKTTFFLTGKLALRFAMDPQTRYGALARFSRYKQQQQQQQHLPLHLDFYGVTVNKVDRFQVPLVRVHSVSLVGAFQSTNLNNNLDGLWEAIHTIRVLEQLTVEQSMALISGNMAHVEPKYDTSLPYWPIRVNLIGCCLRDANFSLLRCAHTVIMPFTTGVTPYQVSQLNSVRTLSLGSGFTDLECVRSLVHLRFLFFRANAGITSLQPLHKLEHLCYVDGTNTNVPLSEWTALKQLHRNHRLCIVNQLVIYTSTNF